MAARHIGRCAVVPVIAAAVAVLALPAAAAGPAHPVLHRAVLHAGLSGTLQVGSRGAQVVMLQRQLGVDADGDFGPMTRSAVVAYEATTNRPQDGVVSPATWTALFGGPPVPGAPPAPPVPIPPPTSGNTLPVVSNDVAARAVTLAASQAGKPYLWGGSGPNAYDCSGLTQWVYHQLGVALPRVTGDQSRAVQHVPYAAARLGDLVLFYDATGAVFHVGIYAGGGQMWDAPHTGTVVQKQAVWTTQVWIGRV